MSLDSREGSRFRASASLLGFGLWWAWYDFFRIADSHLLPPTAGLAMEQEAGRIAVSLGFNLAVLAFALGYRSIGSVLDRPKALAGSIAIEAALSFLFYLPAFGSTWDISTPAIPFFLGLFSVPLFMAWFELYSRLPDGPEGWSAMTVPLCLLFNGCLLLLLLVGHFFLPHYLVAIIHIALFPLSFQALRLSRMDVQKHSSTDCATRFALPKQLLAAVFLFGVLFGLMLNTPFAVAADEHTGIGLEIAGIAIAGLIFLAIWKLNARKNQEGLSNGALSVRCAIAPLTALGALLLPLIAVNNPNLVNAVFWAGYDYLDILMMYLYVEMSRLLKVSPLATNAQGQFADSTGITIGMIISFLATPALRAHSDMLSFISLIVVMLIITMSQTVMTDRKISTLWGLAKTDARSHRDEKAAARVGRIAAEGQLTPRETEVLTLLLSGKRPEQIAKELTVSVKTVRSHIYRIYSKLNIHSHQQLIDRAMENQDKAPRY